MRLIDADNLVEILDEELKDRLKVGTEVLTALKENILVGFAKQVINDAPTVPIVDNYEIVRCKDCKFCKTWYFDKDGDYLWAICTFWNEGSRVDGIDVYKDGFCSNGKRRIDDETG